MNRSADRNLTVGVVLIVIGLALLAGLQTGVGGEAITALIGVAMLVMFVLTRAYGWLVPGMILTGLGMGIIVEVHTSAHGAAVLLGLGIGFLAIYAVDMMFDGAGRPWPWIPGGILSAVGLMILLAGTAAGPVLALYWPVLLIVIGIVLLVAGPFRRVRHLP